MESKTLTISISVKSETKKQVREVVLLSAMRRIQMPTLSVSVYDPKNVLWVVNVKFEKFPKIIILNFPPAKERSVQGCYRT